MLLNSVLISRALLFSEGSKTENHIREILTGKFKCKGPSVEEMWYGLSISLRQDILTVYRDVYLIDMRGMGNEEVIETIINKMAELAGKAELYKRFREHELISMPSTKFEYEFTTIIAQKKRLLESRQPDSGNLD
ncbi:hypothetical protein [Vibrio sp. WXL210]|uniref:hypothetical protein n=1 Tax=Vibrio sp. WXL210 TaxID=3450709 RepID=UPI003EC92E6B